jgi:glutaryl-CoA dehydrogenase
MAFDDTISIDAPAPDAGSLADAVQHLDAAAGWDDDTRRLGDTLRGFVEGHWLPAMTDVFESDGFSRDVMRELGELGAFGSSLRGSYLRTFAVMHALEWGDAGLRLAATIQDSVIQTLVRYGSEEQRTRWVPPLLAGEQIASFSLTEPEAGSDVRALKTVAARRGSDWVLRGQKSWSTNAPQADVLLVWARTSERNDAIRGFLVERGTPGLAVAPRRHRASVRGVTVGDLSLDDVRVPASSLIPHAWGLTDLNVCLDYNRMTVAFGVTGAARACLELAIRHAKTRRQFGVPLAAKQLVQAQLADMATAVVLGETLALRAAQDWDAGALPPFRVSLCKRHNCAAALDVARRARAVFGAQGIDLEAGVMRHLLNLEASSTYGGTHDVHALLLGKLLTGEPAF